MTAQHAAVRRVCCCDTEVTQLTQCDDGTTQAWYDGDLTAEIVVKIDGVCYTVGSLTSSPSGSEVTGSFQGFDSCAACNPCDQDTLTVTVAGLTKCSGCIDITLSPQGRGTVDDITGVNGSYTVTKDAPAPSHSGWSLSGGYGNCEPFTGDDRCQFRGTFSFTGITMTSHFFTFPGGTCEDPDEEWTSEFIHILITYDAATGVFRRASVDALMSPSGGGGVYRNVRLFCRGDDSSSWSFGATAANATTCNAADSGAGSNNHIATGGTIQITA